MARPTMLDIAKSNGSDAVVGLVDECLRAHPELRLGYARTIKKQNYKTLVRTALGNSSGSFRNANEGVAPHKHTYENRLVETAILHPRFEIDKAVADAHEDGPEAYIAIENQGTLEGELQALCKQFYYGTSAGNAKGFPGLLAAVDSGLVVDAGGTTADTGSSVWAVKFGPKDVAWVWGENGKLEMDPYRVESLADDDGNKFDGYVSTMTAYPGVQVASVYSIGRIKKLTAETGKKLTDAHLAELVSKFPAGMKPDVLLMSRRSRFQLQTSRTATTPTGAYVPTPVDHDGIPIEVTDAILDTEALTL